MSFFFILLGGGGVRVSWIYLFLLVRSNVSTTKFYRLRRPIPALIRLGLRHDYCSGGNYVMVCSCGGVYYY